MRTTLVLPVLSLAAVSLAAQSTPMKAPQASPAASATQELGISSFKIEYHSPAVKGRTIWGGLVPFGQIWRAGANEATVLTLSDPVKISGKDLPAGSYALFAIPGKEQWTLILNRQGKQWGAYNYKADQDALRLEVKPSAIPHQEHLQFLFQVQNPQRLALELRWEKLAVGFTMDLDVKGIYWKYLEENLPKAGTGEWRPWFTAARYCLEQGIEPEKAMAWIETSLKAEENGWNLECKARLLERAGKIPEALGVMDRAITLSKGKAPEEYIKGLEKTREAWAAKAPAK